MGYNQTYMAGQDIYKKIESSFNPYAFGTFDKFRP
jgi:hypothetical protein